MVWDLVVTSFYLFWDLPLRDTVGMFADSFVDPFAHVTWREKELFGASGINLII